MLNSVLDDGDILFINFTHTVKTGSDCLHIYLRLFHKSLKKYLCMFMMFFFHLDFLRDG